MHLRITCKPFALNICKCSVLAPTRMWHKGTMQKHHPYVLQCVYLTLSIQMRHNILTTHRINGMFHFYDVSMSLMSQGAARHGCASLYNPLWAQTTQKPTAPICDQGLNCIFYLFYYLLKQLFLCCNSAYDCDAVNN